MKVRGQRVIPPKERLKNKIKVNVETNCWEWQGAKKSKIMQYGNITVGSRTDGSRKTTSTHRYSYEVYKGAIPDGLHVLHSCDNPPCINPDHLFLGTHQDNVDDREKKNRNNMSGVGLSGENHPQSILSWDVVNKIRALCIKRGDITKVAKEMGINRRTVSDVVNFKTWADQPPPEETK